MQIKGTEFRAQHASFLFLFSRANHVLISAKCLIIILKTLATLIYCIVNTSHDNTNYNNHTYVRLSLLYIPILKFVQYHSLAEELTILKG